MDSPDKNIFGNRLMLARKMNGFSLQDLADALQNKITKQALSKYEMGSMLPTSEILGELSKVLKVKPDYFIRQGIVELGQISFRKKSDLSRKNEEAIIEKARDYVERYLEIENILGQEQKFINPIQAISVKSKEDAEMAANKLREKWELGTDPLPSLVEMLELQGIKVLLIDDEESIDGFATITSTGVPLVVVNVKGKSIERVRFTIVHELAHILMMLNEEIKDNHKLVEVLCHCFSSCFILPRKSLIRMIGGNNRNYIAIKELISIKEYFGISIRAILHRLMELHIITENYYKRWVIYMNKTYGAKSEPGEYRGNEQVKHFEQLVARALSEGAISISKAAALCNTNINQLRKGFISVN
ncbi:XRE family transcriptional regulator [Chryseolinea sp. H1M3-3]|uniref:helix-turn-helix domain-containing protein n=1 Tax=Chryseolinea sp. H1M3-3 TaxID=3034144 RepID=UPI0023ECF4C7|nr:XRE family transcriptional regulator [Chryseolinea sp. H1M3-3]